MLLIAAIGVAVVVLVPLLIFRMMLPELIRGRAETALSEALNQPVTIGRARVGVIDGHVSLSRISLSGPDGFSDEDFASVRRVTVDAGMFFVGLPTVESVTIERPRWSLVVREDGARNYRAFRDILDPPEESEDTVEVMEAPDMPTVEAPAQPVKQRTSTAESERRISIGAVTITDARLSIRDEFAAEEPLEVSAEIGSIALEKITVAAGENALLAGRIEDVMLRTTDRWQEPSFLTIPAIRFCVELPSDRDNGEIILHEFVVEEPRMVMETNAERRERQRHENVREFSRVISNAFTSNLPLRLEDSPEDERDDDESVVEEMPPTVADSTDDDERERTERRMRIELAALERGVVILHTPEQDTATTMFDEVSLRLENAALPHREGDSSRLEAMLRSRQLDSELTLKAEGALLANNPMERRTVEIVGRNAPLHLLREVRSGTIDATILATVEQGRAVGSVGFSAGEIDTESNADGPARMIFRSIEFMSALGVGREPIPFDIPIGREDAYDTVGAVVLDVQTHSAGGSSGSTPRENP